MSQQYPTARESPREFSRASGAMLGAQNILLALIGIDHKLSGDVQPYVMVHDLVDLQDMLDETVSCQTQTHALLEKIKHKLSDH